MGDGPSIAVITGAARGIGRAVAEAFAAAGMRVALVDLLEDELGQTADELRASGATVLPLVADVTEREQVEALPAQVEAELGPADVLVNNAGTFSYIGPAWEADPERWFRDTRVSLLGSFLCIRAFVPGMVARGAGRVINMVSGGGVGDPHAYSTSYACAKTALMRLTEGIAQELAPHGVKVFALAPPAVLTEMTRFIMQDPGGRHWRPGFGRHLADGAHPPEAVAAMARWLASGPADVLSGRFIPATQPRDELLARADEIVRDDLLTLRIRRLPKPDAP